MFSTYFKELDIRPEYSKEFVSLWGEWLGEENYHKLDEVTENEWARFGNFLISLSGRYILEKVDYERKLLVKVENIESVLSGFDEFMNKEYHKFTKLVLPELGCVITEEWDYTYIIWHKNNGAVETLAPYIEKAGLKHFHD